MMKIKVEKCEHGGYIAKQESDTPLRYIAAAGDTEAAAVAALFEYHADLIRKDRIDVSEVKVGVRPGDIIPDLGQVSEQERNEDHGKVLTRAMWRFVLPYAYGVEKLDKDIGIDSLICRVIWHCFKFTDQGDLLQFKSEVPEDQELLKWLHLALKCRYRGGAYKMRLRKISPDSRGDKYQEELDGAVSNILYFMRRGQKLPLRLVEAEFVDFIENMMFMYGNAITYSYINSRIESQYLLCLLSMDCLTDGL